MMWRKAVGLPDSRLGAVLIPIMVTLFLPRVFAAENDQDHFVHLLDVAADARGDLYVSVVEDILRDKRMVEQMPSTASFAGKRKLMAGIIGAYLKDTPIPLKPSAPRGPGRPGRPGGS